MVIAKKFKNFQVLIFLFLILFPLGQLLRTDLLLGDFHLVVHPVDIVVGTTAVKFLITSLIKKRKVSGFALGFMACLLSSYLFSYFIFKGQNMAEGFFYLIRLLAYIIFAFVVKENTVSEKLRRNYYSILIILSLIIAVFGWFQYLVYPDVRILYYLGWDDHLYRIVGTFLDPGFTSILILFGVNLVLVKIFEKFKYYWLIILLILLSALFFTYARAGYVALLGSVVVLLYLKKKMKFLLPLAGLIVIVILLLPRPSSSGAQLERLYSVFLRIKNYQETLGIWSKWPVLGVGYNNMCTARVFYLGEESSLSHSCSGSDSSLLLLMATTGFIGLSIFLRFVYSLVSTVNKNVYGEAFIACLAALFIHSFFVNSLFYPWVMGYVGILYAIASTSSNEG